MTRGLLAAALLVASCKSDPAPAPSVSNGAHAPPESAPAPIDHDLHGGISETAGEVRAQYVGIAVDLATVSAIQQAIGLPMRGTADIAIDVSVPRGPRGLDYRRASGVIDLRCDRCQVGDDKTHIKPPNPSRRQQAFTAEGFQFGHIAFERAQARIEIGNGRADLVYWHVKSPDVVIELRATAELGATLAQSTLDGCLRFTGTPELAKRDSATSSVLLLTGAMRQSDDLFHIKLGGDLADPKRLPLECH